MRRLKMKAMLLRVALSAVGALCPWLVLGQALPDTLRGERLADVEVTARSLSRGIASTTPVSEMDARRMELLGLSSWTDAVRLLSGVAVRDYGGVGGLKTVSVRHLGAHHTGISYDGVVVGHVQAGQIDLSRFQLDNAGSLRMTVGQEPSLLQSARHYATAGVLSVTTAIPDFRRRPHGLRASLRGGSFGHFAPSIRYSQRLSDATSLTFDGTYLRADGDYPFTLRNGRHTTRERRLGSDVEVWQGEANLRQALSGGGRLNVKAQGYASERGLPGGVILYRQHPHERLWEENYALQAYLQQPLGGGWTMAARLRYEHGWNRYEDVDVKYADGRQVDLHHQTEYYASATVAWQPTPSWGVAVAEDVAYGTLSNNVYEGAEPRRWTSLTALSARYSHRRWTLDGRLVGTLAQDRRTLQSSARDRLDRHCLSPSLSFSWRLLRTEPLYLRAMLKQTFRQPSFNDLYYRRFGTVDLRPEQAWMYGLGLAWSGNLHQRLYIEATADGYFNRVTDKIVAFPAAYVWRMMNLGRVDIAGLDVALQAQCPLTAKWHVDVNASYALQHAVDRTDERRAYYGLQIPYTPRHSATASAILATPWLHVGYTLQACSERYSDLLHSDDTRMAPYVELHLTLSRDLAVGDGTLSLSASVRNLADTQFEIIRYYPMPGRHWQAEIKYRF